MDEININTTQSLSVIKNPFSTNCIKSINIRISDFWDKGQYEYTARIEFKNGNTSGEQYLKGQSFEDIISQVKSVLNNL